MSGKGLQIIARSRPIYSLAPNKLTFTVPADAQTGDILLVLLCSKPGESSQLPTGWTNLVGPGGATEAQLQLAGRVHDEADPASVAFTLNAVTGEWQGQLVVIRGGALATLNEATASQAIAADLTPDVPNVPNHQPLNLMLGAWSVSGAIDFTVDPTEYSVLDEYTTAVVVQRTLLVAWRQTQFSPVASGSHPSVDANPAATGRGFSTILRERSVLTPNAVLDDPIPGNIGLLAR